MIAASFPSLLQGFFTETLTPTAAGEPAYDRQLSRHVPAAHPLRRRPARQSGLHTEDGGFRARIRREVSRTP